LSHPISNTAGFETKNFRANARKSNRLYWLQLPKRVSTNGSTSHERLLIFAGIQVAEILRLQVPELVCAAAHRA
jgi:hypothetical protein